MEYHTLAGSRGYVQKYGMEYHSSAGSRGYVPKCGMKHPTLTIGRASAL